MLLTNFKQRRILIAPLDWGLGHTTRCIPIIRHLIRLGHAPLVAVNATQRSFIEAIFNGIEIIDLGGYNIRYSKAGWLGALPLLAQVPGIVQSIKTEHDWLEKLAGQARLDGIISDNRYGLYHPEIPSVILTHQLRVQTGVGNIADGFIQSFHYRYLSKFNAVWVPDVPGTVNLGGVLSHPAQPPKNTKYIGLLSQFDEKLLATTTGDHLLVLLSGPEPQRTFLAELLARQLHEYDGEVVMVGGTESHALPSGLPGRVSYVHRTNGGELADLIARAHLVICRSGYSTLMDLVLLGKRALLIPTPGQTEQCYLGKFLNGARIFPSLRQQGFQLTDALQHLQSFPFRSLELKHHFKDYQPVLEHWLDSLPG